MICDLFESDFASLALVIVPVAWALALAALVFLRAWKVFSTIF